MSLRHHVVNYVDECKIRSSLQLGSSRSTLIYPSRNHIVVLLWDSTTKGEALIRTCLERQQYESQGLSRFSFISNNTSESIDILLLD